MTTERERYDTGRVVDSRGPEDRLRERAGAVNKGIRKVGKAHWEFRCVPCNVSATGVDQWSVYEYGWNHNRDAATSHAMKAIGSAIDTLSTAFSNMLKPVIEAAETIGGLYAVPPNRPHDPYLLSDKRKWGGK